MRLPEKTSRLLDLQKSAQAELNARFAEIFQRYRSVAFIARRDQLFQEHWTPEMAASGYQFSGFEIDSGQIVLHGTEAASGFVYGISIAFPLELADKPAAINAHFEEKCAEAVAQRDPNDDVNPAVPTGRA